MGFLKSKLIGFLLCSFALSAQATNKSSVINKTDQKIAVTWTALGCLHNEFRHGDVCGGRILDPGHSQRYQFNWGDVNDHIHIGGYFKKVNRYLVSGAIVGFNPELPFLVQTIGGNCQLPSPDEKVVAVSSITVDEDKWTVDCEYQIHDMNDDELLYGQTGEECNPREPEE
ncbi:hypothetical protein [Endozoicomonas sp.]|uniref:hypothetical protein n=1 Tax=Endozoicomonas sp. TaxID=1892382 RepID=UPI002886A269|nr:hypothetical protein [Endozoicomonas sp.]